MRKRFTPKPVSTLLAAKSNPYGITDLTPSVASASAVENSLGSALPWVVAFLMVAGIGAVAVLMIRSRLIAQSHLRGGEDATVTLLITIPRFRNQEDAKQTDAAAAILPEQYPDYRWRSRV